MWRRAACMALFPLLGAAGLAEAQRPSGDKTLPELLRRLSYPATRATKPVIRTGGRFDALVLVNETEPNDDFSSADAVSIGDQASGAIDPAGDLDAWMFSAAANTILDIDVDAEVLGSDLDPVIGIFSSAATLLAVNDDADGLDSRIKYTVQGTDNYFLAIIDFDETVGGPTYTYTINLGTATPGPGDPISIVEDEMLVPFAIAAGPNGDLFIGEASDNSIRRVTPSGGSSTFASNIEVPLGMAFDVFGNLLVVSGDNRIYRFTPTGQRGVLIQDVTTPFWIAIGSDGSIWVSDLNTGHVRRYDLRARFKESIDLSSFGGAGPIGFSPSGELHFSNGPSLFKIVAGQPELLFSRPGAIWGFAFDVDGNIYVPEDDGGSVVRYGPNGTILDDPFVNGLQLPLAAAFGRNADGTTNSTLNVADAEVGLLARANPAGVPAAGWPVGVSLDVLVLEEVVDELLGPGGMLEQPKLGMLDALGNDNGLYDVGDFRAYLEETNRLDGTSMTAITGRAGPQR